MMSKLPKWVSYGLTFICAGFLAIIQANQEEKRIEQLAQKISEDVIHGKIESAESIQPAEDSANEDA